MAPLDAVVRVCQMGGASTGSGADNAGIEGEPEDVVGDKWSLVVAICVRSKARSLRRSVGG